MTRKENEAVDHILSGIDVSVFREIGDAIEIALAVFDANLRLVFANRKFHQTHHASPGSLPRGESFEDIIRRVYAVLPSDLRAEILTEMVAQARAPDGKFREKQTTEGRYFRYRMVGLSDGNVLFTVQNVTARRIHQIRLEEKSRQLAVILEEMAEGVIILDRDNNLVLANQGLMDMYSFPVELNRPGTPGKEFARWRLSREQKLAGNELDEAAERRIQSIFDATTQVEHAGFEALEDGRIIEVRRRRTPEGYLISTYVDISERIRAKQALEESEMRYKAILEDQTEYISRIDANLSVTFANTAYKRTFLGNPDAQSIDGLNILSLIADDNARAHYEHNMRSLTPENPILKSELWERVADGSLQWQAWTDRALFDDDGKLVGYQSVGRDITEKKIAQDALAANLRERDAIVTGAIDAIVSVDSDGRVRDFNAAAERMFGFAKAEAQGRFVKDLIIPPEKRDAHTDGMARYLAGKPSGNIVGERTELEALKKDGSRFPIELAVVDASGDGQALFVAYVRDLTKARELEATLEQQRQAMAQSEKMSALGSLLANVAHELNNPLSVVIGQADLLRELATDDKTKQRGDRIKSAADRCANIIKTFLAMARQKPPEYRTFNAAQPIAEALELVEYGLRTTGIDLTVDIDGELPDLHGDPTQIGQVLTNLLVNAQHALSDQPQPRRIAVAADLSPDRSTVILRVADNGPGIPPENRDRIFEPFFTTKHEGSGTGIGLAIAHNIATSHGGNLLLLEGGPGAVFELSLPVHLEDTTAAGIDVSETSNNTSGNLRILIVDDEADVAETIADTLSLSGFDCETAGGGRQALNRIEEEHFDIVLSDLRMPDLDGPALFQRVVDLWPEKRRCFGFFTGDTLSPNASRFLSTENVPFIEKPFTRAALENLIERIIRKTD